MTTIELPPGVVNTASRKAKTGSCRETHIVRWEGGTMLPFGGWEAIDYAAGVALTCSAVSTTPVAVSLVARTIGSVITGEVSVLLVSS